MIAIFLDEDETVEDGRGTLARERSHDVVVAVVLIFVVEVS